MIGIARSALAALVLVPALLATPGLQDPSFDPFAVPAEGDKITLQATVSPTPARAGETVHVVLAVSIQEGWHLYGSLDTEGTPTTVSVTEAAGLTVGAAEVPGGDPHEAFGIASFWIVGEAVLRQPLTIPAGTKPGTLKVEGHIDYMACTEEFCDPPAQAPFEVEVVIEAGAAREAHIVAATPAAAGGSKAAGSAPGGPAAGGPAAGGSGAAGSGAAGSGAAGSGASEPAAGAARGTAEEGAAGEGAAANPDDDLSRMPLGLFLLVAVGWGLFALAMPCTYPMIPITISFFTKQAANKGGSALPLALIYGFGIIGMFVAIGAAIGPIVVTFATHPVTNLIIAALFFVFALVLLGVLNLQPPAFLMNFANRSSNTGGVAGVFLMGATLVITSFTCTAPFVGNLLALGAEGGDFSRVLLGMAVFGATMATPFVFLSLAPSRMQAMPRSGEWMNTLKVFLGFVELAAALKFLSNADMVWGWEWLSRELFLTLWAGIFGIAALLLLGVIKLKGEDGQIGSGRLVGALGVVLLSVYCAYGAAGNRMDWVMTAMAPPYSNRVAWAASGGGEGESEASTGHTIVEDDYTKARQIAIDTNRKLLLNFTGVT